MRLRPYRDEEEVHVEAEPEEDIDFDPFTFCVEVATPEELAYLWALFNMSPETLVPAIQRAATERPKAKGPFRRSFIDKVSQKPQGKRDIWKLLNSKLKESGILLR